MPNVTTFVAMRDGTQLFTYVDFPPSLQPGMRVPTVLDRSPYGPDFIATQADLFLRLGHVAVRQMVRGTNASGGNFDLWHDCVDDGYDTLSWIVAQPWSDGTVMECGTSADGIDAIAQAPAPHPALRAQFVQFGALDGRESFFPGGAFKLAFIETWVNNNVPYNVTGEITAVAEHEGPGPWWDMLNSSLPTFFDAVAWPVVASSGWYDLILAGALSMFSGLRARSAPAVRSAHRLVVDPLGHCSAAALFPRNTLSGHAALSTLLALDLFQNGSWVGPTPEGVDTVTFYVMGALSLWEPFAPGSYWTTLPAWPAYTRTPLYLGAGRALALAPDASSGNASFRYEPDDAMPTYGGSNFYLSCGPLDQRVLEEGVGYRNDVLTFTSPRAPSPVAFVGPLSADLWVSSSAVDTDFTAKLTDVYPNGSSLLLQDGIVRMRWRGGAAQPAPQAMVPGEVYAVTVDLWATAYILNAGHALRLDISSSNYPRFSPNPNTGVPLVTPWAPVNVTNTLHFGGATPSALWLPIVNASLLKPFPVFDAVDAMARRLGLPGTPPSKGPLEERRAHVERLDDAALAGVRAQRAAQQPRFRAWEPLQWQGHHD